MKIQVTYRDIENEFNQVMIELKKNKFRNVFLFGLNEYQPKKNYKRSLKFDIWG